MPLYRILIALIFLSFFNTVAGTVPFITTWEVTTANESIIIPTTGAAGYNYTVDWGDTTTTVETTTATHTYTTPGIYTVSITGDFPTIHFDARISIFTNPLDKVNAEKIQTIDQWGNNQWTTMESAFAGCSNLNITNGAIDTPDLSLATSLSQMFRDCTSFNFSINNWDVSHIEEMDGMFQGANIFNQDLNTWNVSNVKTMNAMFSGASLFNGDISTWDVRNVENMGSMFSSAIAFNGDISEWETDSVMDMQWMFANTSAFNQDIGGWNVSNVEFLPNTFENAIAFDQDIGDWDVSNVKDMDRMFFGVTLSIANYDALLIGWNDRNLRVNVRFSGGNSQYCAGEEARENIITSYGWPIVDAGRAGPTVEGIEDQEEPNSFTFPEIIGIDLTGNEAYYTDTNGEGTKYEEGDILEFDAGTTYPIPIYIYHESATCSSEEEFELTLIECIVEADVLPDVSVCNTVYELPHTLDEGNRYFTESGGPEGIGEELFPHEYIVQTQTIYIYAGDATCNAETSFVVTILETGECGRPFITTWQTTTANESITIPRHDETEGYNYTVDWGDGTMPTFETADATHIYTTADTYTVSITGGFPRIYFDARNTDPNAQKIRTIEQWGDNQWISMEEAFEGCTNLNITNVGIDTPDLSLATSLSQMFEDCRSFNFSINNWDVSTIEDMDFMFVQANTFNQDLNAWNVSNVKTMIGMFSGASEFNGNISNWDVRNVENMGSMFSDTEAFDNDISEWETNSLTDMQRMFQNALAFNQDIGSWNVSRVTFLSDAFSNAIVFNQDISEWDVSNVRAMSNMFAGAIAFDQDIGDWNVRSLLSATNLFAGVTLSIANYDALLIGWNDKNLISNVNFSGGNSKYCEGEEARENMIASDGWTITDEGKAGPTVDDIEDQEAVGSYAFEEITGDDLTEGVAAYYTEPNGGGTEYKGGAILEFDPRVSYPIMIYIYHESATCSSEEDFQLTLTPCTVEVQVLPDVSECTIYELPVLSAGNNYYTDTGGTGTLLFSGDLVEETQTIYIYTDVLGCTDESSFVVTILDNPIADVLSDVSECTIYELPVLDAGNSYYTGTGGTGTLLSSGDIIEETQTIYIYTDVLGCTDESSFVVTILGNPTADVLSDVSECTIYELPVLSTGNNYYTATGGTGTLLFSGDIIEENQTIYIYTDVLGCTDESSFVVTILGSPTADVLSDVSECTIYELPVLSTGNNYYTATGATGTLLSSGDIIEETQTIYIYTDVLGCTDESSFVVTILDNPIADILSDVSECVIYELPVLSAGNNYYTGTGATGTLLSSGDIIEETRTIYIYTDVLGCTDESSFVVTILGNPTADVLSDVSECVIYELPVLSAGNNYYTGVGATGTLLSSGDIIEDTQTIYIYTDVLGCTDESSFVVTILDNPIADILSDVSECASYELPVLDAGNSYYTGTGATGTLLSSGDIIEETQTIYIYTGNNNTCDDESSFVITIDETICNEEILDFLPKFFTPNGDGIHDTFKLIEQAIINKEAKVSIYDRFGKLLKQFDLLTGEWDGTFGGKPMLTTEYWYLVEFTDGESVNGHFSLIRR